MIIYEATIEYRAVGQVDAESLSTPSAVAQYMRSAFEQHPLQEQVWVICLEGV